MSLGSLPSTAQKQEGGSRLWLKEICLSKLSSHVSCPQACQGPQLAQAGFTMRDRQAQISDLDPESEAPLRDGAHTGVTPRDRTKSPECTEFSEGGGYKESPFTLQANLPVTSTRTPPTGWRPPVPTAARRDSWVVVPFTERRAAGLVTSRGWGRGETQARVALLSVQEPF